ncbi:hypothetical protein OF83DRAFT_1289699 [Amylostereum chailletii]|nr:hypothetical protein OF83DRAFT_1289699 [Amylostereum chailletii]
MSRKESISKKLFVLDFDILHPSRISSDDDLTSALETFEGCLDAFSTPHMIEKSLRVEHAFEYIMGAMSMETHHHIVDFILSQFPASATTCNSTSVAVRCLATLSLTLCRLGSLRETEATTMDGYRRTIELAPRVLHALASMLDDPAFVTRADEKPIRGQHPRKKSRAMSRSEVVVDVKAFRDLDIQVPGYREDAEQLVETILNQQRDILVSLLQIVRRPDVATSIKEKYIASSTPASTVTSPLSPTSNGSEGVVARSPTLEGPMTAFPFGMVSSVKANLLYESPADFGVWRIFTSERARRDLKKLGKGGTQAVEPMRKKLAQLSCGQFTQTNYKKITNSSPVHIYEARLPGDLRLVYQIDCIRERKGDTPHQVITLFGLCDHEEVVRVSWDRMGRYQANRKGREYCDACRFRELSPDGYTFVPHDFPLGDPTGEQAWSRGTLSKEDTSGLSKEDEDEMYSLLTLGKYARVSENFLKGILLDEDVAQTYQLSDREQEVVEHTGSCFVMGRSGTGKTTTICFKIFGLERAWGTPSPYESRPRQIFLTKSRLLARKVENDLIELIRSDVMSKYAPQHFVDRVKRSPPSTHSSMFNIEDLETWRADLPTKYSQLKDEHFPLIITFNDLCTMLEGDLIKPPPPAKVRSTRRNIQKETWSAQYRKAMGPQYISFEDFKTKYWPHFPQHTRRMSPSQAYGQFVGVIKGSEDALNSPRFILDRDTYDKRGSPVDYSLFEKYLSIKMQRGERDVADRTHDLLQALKEKGVPGRKLDYLYVDEVQDNNVIDILLMRQLCRNPEGSFWAGDVAQTISFGSTFHFAELKAMLYRYERSNYSLNLSRNANEPPTFQLLTNYRSPRSIVDCANSVISFLKLFPNAVDALDKEEGIIDGVKPVFVGLGDEARFFDAFDGRSSVRLGAKQCILVRDVDAQQRLRKITGKIGVILTIPQSKGLEFDDVLLYNFFEDSTVDFSGWRRLVEYAHLSTDMPDGRYSPMASELKFLYVAITRTRKHLWIADTSAASRPMQRFWETSDLVAQAEYGTTLAEFENNPQDQDWTQTARMLFQQANFEGAADAYEAANRFEEAAVARAYQLKQDADGQPLEKKRLRREAYVAAATALVVSAKGVRAKDERCRVLQSGAECYAEVDLHEDAARTYYMAEKWTEAAIHYFDGGRLKEAVAVVQKHESRIETPVFDKIIGSARVKYLEHVELDDAAALFSSYEEQEEFMIEHDFRVAHAAAVERREGSDGVVKAAKLYYDEERILKAINLLIENLDVPEASPLAKQYLRELFWRNMSFGTRTWTSALDVSVDEMSGAITGLEDAFSSEDELNIIRMFKAAMVSDIKTLEDLAHIFCKNSNERMCEALFCLDYLFDDLARMSTRTEHGSIVFLEIFGHYVRLMHEVIVLDAPWDCPIIQELFCFQKTDDDHVELRNNGTSFLSRTYTEKNVSSLSLPVFATLLRTSLGDRLQTRIRLQHEISKSVVHVFDPCYDVATGRKCNKDHTHPTAHELDPAWYHRRVHYHLQQIIILHYSQTLRSGDDFRTRMVQRRNWLARLESALCPLLYTNGSMSLFRPDLVPVASEGFSVVKQWTADVLYGLDPSRENLRSAFLTNFLNAAKLGLRLDVLDEVRVVERCLDSIPCVRSRWHQHPELMDFRGRYVRPFNNLHNLVAFMRREGDLASAVRFLSVIANRRISLDFGTLCDFIDRVCAATILVGVHRRKASLHDVTLPRSWIVECWDDFLAFDKKDKNVPTPWDLLKPLQLLVEDVYTGNISVENLLHRSKELSPWQVRDACLARICRVLCLVGYNCPSVALRNEIHTTIHSLQDLSAPFYSGPLHKLYVYAEGWPNLSRIVMASARGSFDEMLQLYLSDGPLLGPTSLHVRRIHYHDLDDIPRLVSHAQLSFSKEPALSIPLPSIDSTQDEPDLMEEAPVDDTVYRSDQMQEDANNLSYALTDEDERRLFGKQGIAARAIQKICRRMLDHIHSAPTEPLPAARDRLYRACLLESQKPDFVNASRSFRIVYRGILPHVLLCVDWTLAHARQEKIHIKKERATAAVEDLFELSQRQTAMNGFLGSLTGLASRVMKNAEDMQDVLQPSSSIYQEKTENESLMAWQKAIKQIRRMLSKFEWGVKELDEDMGLLTKWMDVSSDRATSREGK